MTALYQRRISDHHVVIRLHDEPDDNAEVCNLGIGRAFEEEGKGVVDAEPVTVDHDMAARVLEGK